MNLKTTDDFWPVWTGYYWSSPEIPYLKCNWLLYATDYLDKHESSDIQYYSIKILKQNPQVWLILLSLSIPSTYLYVTWSYKPGNKSQEQDY